ncbi:MAG: hypothetical protein IJP77_06235 [Bacteroidales bacterium]|nr:hypothetical protein [Bacteroidales bacterium]
MKIREAIRSSEWVIIPLLLIVASFFAGDYYGQKKVESSIVAHTDTVVRVVPVYKDFPQPQKTVISGFIPIPRCVFLTDTVKTVETLVLHDTTYVYLPREQQYYVEADGKLRIWISGYDPRLDRYEFDAPEKIINTTVTQKPSRWSISLQGGCGVMFVDGKLRAAPYIGGGVSYTLFWL